MEQETFSLPTALRIDLNAAGLERVTNRVEWRWTAVDKV
jgi:hypothetical protein